MTAAYIGLGGNEDDSFWRMKNSLANLQEIPDIEVTTCSSFYRTTPVGPQDQPDFINAVARLETTLSAFRLLQHMQDIEHKYGRRRGTEQWGPRPLDLDLLLFGQQRIDDEYLKVPHPEMSKRGFVLYPLAEIAPDIEIPDMGTVRRLLKEVDASGIERIE